MKKRGNEQVRKDGLRHKVFEKIVLDTLSKKLHITQPEQVIFVVMQAECTR